MDEPNHSPRAHAAEQTSTAKSSADDSADAAEHAVGAGQETADPAHKADPVKEPAQPSLADIKPWEGKARPADKVLMWLIFGVPAFYLIMWPFRPMLIASQPVLLEFITGAKTVIVGAAAFARVGEVPLWLVCLAGFAGMAKFDWIFWWAGRRWADRVVNLFAGTEKARRRFRTFRNLPTWLLVLLVLIGRVPGVPGSIAWLVAGWNRMPLWLFLAANLTGSAIMTAIWVALGYMLGQQAVDVIEVIDKYSLWLTLALIVGMIVYSGWKSARSNAGKS